MHQNKHVILPNMAAGVVGWVWVGVVMTLHFTINCKSKYELKVEEVRGSLYVRRPAYDL